MTASFVDTSALIKRYLREVGSQWIRTWIEQPNPELIAISDVTIVEMLSIFARRRLARDLSLTSATRLQNAFVAHVQQDYLLTTVDNPVFVAANKLASAYGLRALDAIQLSAALSARDTLQEPLTFISADAELLIAAAAEGFAVDNPLNHP